MPKIIVNKETCIGCGACVNTCPQGVFKLDDEGKAQVVNQPACLGCSACEETCPVGAITVELD